MLVSDVINLVRQLLNDPSTTGRWSQSALSAYVNEAQQSLVRDTQFPESRVTAMTIPNLQEYTLPENIYCTKVYLAGQLIVPTTLDAIEGIQTQYWDQGLAGGISQPGGQTPGSGGPWGTAGSYTPSWNIQVPQVYPVANSWSGPAPDTQFWSTGQRPRAYWRSGSAVLGLIPAPASITTLVIEGLFVPPQVTQPTDVLMLPMNFKRALAWKAVEYAKFSDDDSKAAEQRTYAAQQYEMEMKKLRGDHKRADGKQPRGPKLRTYRSAYQLGNNRQPGPWTEYS